MTNYNNSKIYKIMPVIEHDKGDIYIGSTTKQYLSQRMVAHRAKYRAYQKGLCGKNKSESNFYKTHTGVPQTYLIFDKYGLENCNIVLLETVHANSKDELMSRERHYIQTLKCVNKRIPCRYGSLNRAEYLKQYKLQNKNKIFQPTYCYVCNCSVTKANFSKHEKSLKHQSRIKIEYEYFYENGTPCTIDEYNLYNN